MTGRKQPELHAILDVEQVNHSIAGRLRDEFGHEHPFTGWLGLIGAVQAGLTGPTAFTLAQLSTEESK